MGVWEAGREEENGPWIVWDGRRGWLGEREESRDKERRQNTDTFLHKMNQIMLIITMIMILR